MLALLWKAKMAPPSETALLVLNCMAVGVEPVVGEPMMVRATPGDVKMAPPWMARLLVNPLSTATRHPAAAQMAPPTPCAGPLPMLLVNWVFEIWIPGAAAAGPIAMAPPLSAELFRNRL